MRIVAINTCDYGSTGKIMRQIAENAETKGHSYWIAIPKGRHNKTTSYEKTIWIGSRFSEDTHILLGRITGLQGCFSIVATWDFLNKLDKVNPDIIHMHNLHNSYINLPMLFSYIKTHNIKAVWTLHDCWAFTGHCPHFTAKKCDKWITGCNDCSSFREYPCSFFDHSRWMWRHKKKWFSGIKNMVIVTPSKWLMGLTEKSFLGEYPTRVINNGVDLDIFRNRKSTFREKHNIEDKVIVLGVAFDWGYRKGLDVFVKLSSKLDDRYKIVLVGTNDSIDRELPNNIISIHKTQNQIELAEIYSVADVLFNPTREDNYPTVNMEAIACDTPVITFRTGGSPETVLNESCGAVIDDTEDIEYIYNQIVQITSRKDISCREYSSNFDKNARFDEYVKLYEDLI